MNGDEEREDDGRIVSENLIPGLPDDVVLQHVASRLSWNTMLALTALNRPWRTAIRSREVHQLKKLSKTSSTQTLVVIYVQKHDGRRLALYDLERREVYLLPPLPPPFKLTLFGLHIVVHDGRIYVMGDLCDDPNYIATNVVLELDIVACQGVWARYERDPSSRAFGYSDVCMACDGKIYVFHKYDLASGELFDPCCNEWSRIAEPSGKDIVNQPSVTIFMKKIFFFSGTERHSMVYNIEDSDWQVIETAAPPCKDHPFCVMNGELYRFNCTYVEVYKAESNSWARFQTISDPGVEYGFPVRVIPFDSEVLTLLEYSDFRIVRQSVGFGVEGVAFSWKDISCPTLQSLSTDDRVKLDFGQFFEGSVEF